MTKKLNSIEQIEAEAASYPEVTTGQSCNQTSFKVGKGSFLFIGPGPKGHGFKAMFKLKESMSEAQKLAEQEPKKFEVGKTGWVTTRFSAEEPLPEPIWKKWLSESYDVTCGSSKKK
ncbi:MAG: MmcQ/YjbR family DNA-binding protein [Kangiellaceae bacterium]|nr:MmcQ/YjbR family DNA-binding protein [Kangiellaceae bacterium]MCW9000697.1 MmcQ/YjbR family DNA-binding protein [Kangiellaceae bacterium]